MRPTRSLMVSFLVLGREEAKEIKEKYEEQEKLSDRKGGGRGGEVVFVFRGSREKKEITKMHGSERMTIKNDKGNYGKI